MPNNTQEVSEAINKADAPTEVEVKPTHGVAKTDVKEVALTETKEISQNNTPARLINTMAEMEAFADTIAKSAIWSSAFESNVKAEDGSIITVVKKEDIIGNIVLAHELGLTPMQGIILGKTLNREAAIKVQHGRELGISTYAALKEIHIWNTGARELVYVGIGIIHGILLRCGVKLEIERYPNTSPKLLSYKDRQEVVYNEAEHVIINGLKEEDLKKQLTAGKKPVIKVATPPDEVVAIVRITRGSQSLALPYSLQDAIDADLAPGTKTDGDESKGKDNWKKHPKTMLIHRSTMLSARIVVADVLSGIYIADEVPTNSVKDTDVQEVSFEEV